MINFTNLLKLKRNRKHERKPQAWIQLHTIQEVNFAMILLKNGEKEELEVYLWEKLWPRGERRNAVTGGGKGKIDS